MKQFNYVIARYWYEDEGEMCCYMTGNSEVRYGSMEQAERELAVVKRRCAYAKAPDDYQIFKVVPLDWESSEVRAKQAKIDELMLEYCPDEVTDEQWEEYSKHQRVVYDGRLNLEKDIPVITALREALVEPEFTTEQEPVAKIALKNCIYFDSIDFNQTPPYLRYDTGDSTPKENWTVYCDIQEDLRKNGYELTDSDVDHDTVCGDVTPIAAPVRAAVSQTL